MKRLMILFLLFISTCFIGKASRPILNIHVEKAGTLDQISVTVPPCIDMGGTSFMCGLDVKITGELNEEDFRTLSQLLEHRFFSLDLSEVELAEIPRKAFMIRGGTNAGVTACDAWIEKIILPATLTTINDLAFGECTYLKEVDLSRCTKLNYVGFMAFGNCANLLSIDFSNCTKLKILGDNAGSVGPFYGCNGLKNIILSPNLEIIDSGTFQSCDLEEIEIPSSVKYIKSGAFDLYGLREIKMHSYEPPVISQNTFASGVTDNAILKVPSGQLSKYKEAEYWRDFSSIEEYNINGGDLIYHSIHISYNGGYVDLNDNYIENGSSVSITDQTDIRLLIKPKTGYHLKQVMANDKDVTDNVKENLLILPSVSCDQMITITFELDIYTVQVSYNEGGTVKVNDDIVTSGLLSSVTALTNVKVVITPGTGYHIKQVLCFKRDVTNQLKNNVWTISSILLNTEITITFEKDAPINHVLKVSYNEGGTVKVNNNPVTNGSSTSIIHQTDIQLSVIPNTDYHLKQVMVGNTDMTQEVKNNLLLLSAISENKDIKVTFAKDTVTSYTFRVFYGGYGNGAIKVNGNMAPNGYSITVPVIKKIELIFQSNEGYYLKKAMLGSIDITNQIVDNHYTIPTLSSDASLSVTFEKIPTYSLNINMVDGSSSIKINEKVITNSTQITEIKEGSPILLNFMPSKYYVIMNVTLGDKNITGLIKDGFYEIKSIKSNLSLQVEYSKKEYTLSLTSLQGIERIRIGNTEHYDKSSFILTPGIYNLAIFSNSNYLITQVLSEGEKLYDNLEGESSYFGSIDMDHDKEITILLKLREKRERTVVLEQPGTLSSFLTEEDMNLITHLRIEGKIDQRDFVVINQMKLLSKLFLDASIVNYSIYPANTIPEKAFYNNRNIQTIYLPHSIESIDKQAFYGSSISLFEASGDSYKHLNKIGEEAFKNCLYLIEAPLLITNVPVIEKGVFENCSNLITFSTSLPNLVEIKESAFRNCKNLCLSFEPSLERIADYAFENMKSVNFNSWIEEAKLSYLSTNALKGCPTDNFDFTNYPYLKELPVFEGCSQMVSITFPPNVKRISANAFKGCTSLQHVHMNEKIEYIAENAFCDCKGITYLYVPINKAPEVFANSFGDFNYVLAKLVVPADYMYFYRYHTVWGKFNNIEYFGDNSVRQIQTVISQGGFVKLKGENNISFDETICREGIYFNLYPTSSRVELIVEPEEGYSTESVILNGENVTNRLDKNYKFVIPYLLDDTELEVKFKKDNSTDIEIVNTKKRVYISDSNQLSLAGFRIGTYVSVYDTSGRLITQRILHDNMEKISLPCKGVYFIKVGKEAFKIIY